MLFAKILDYGLQAKVHNNQMCIREIFSFNYAFESNNYFFPLAQT